MMNRKSQSAMEYLMTYGWAILVVLIALGALFYLGVFNPKTPSTCNANAPLTCTDVVADNSAGTITLVLASTGTSDADVTGITIDSPSGITTCAFELGELGVISTDTPTGIKWDSCAFDNEGDKLSGSAEVTYQLQGSTETHTTTVQFSGTIEA